MSLTVALFVRNKNDDFISNVCLSPAPAIDVTLLTKLVVTSYTRDPYVLQWKGEKISVKDVNNDRHKHFAGFMKYLFERKKAAEAVLPNGLKFYLLPPDSASSTSLCGVFPAIKEKPNNPTQATSATQSIKTPAKTSSGGNFLNSLLSKVESTAASRTSAPVSTSQFSNLHALQERISAELAAFVADTTATMKAFEPMEREQRQIVHDATNDFNDVLVSSSLGDDIDRHVVVYKRGHEPHDVEFFAGMKQVHKPTIRRKTPVATKYKPLDIKALDSNVQAVNTVKRDRRTIEEIQQTIKKRKMDENGESQS